MATIQDRPFSRNYSGLENQLAVGGVVAAFCLTAYELMRRKRRGRGRGAKFEDGLGSVETWEFGYLYQGRCWAKKPSPALPKWPLSWVIQAIRFPSKALPDLLGLDAALYIRFLRACKWFTALQTCTTFPVLFTIHVVLSPDDLPDNSMLKASVSSLVKVVKRLKLLYVHVVLAYWLSITWIIVLLWISRETFRDRARAIRSAAKSFAPDSLGGIPQEKPDDENRGLRLRTVMVTNVPQVLRNEKALKEYFEYYMSRPLGTTPITPGFFARLMTHFFNRAASSSAVQRFKHPADEVVPTETPGSPLPEIVQRVVIARKTTELASLLARHDDVLKKLEHAHVRLARTALQAARAHRDNPSERPETQGLLTRISSRKSWMDARRKDEEHTTEDSTADHLTRLNTIAETLEPFVSMFHVPSPTTIRHNLVKIFQRESSQTVSASPPGSPSTHGQRYDTVWEALHSLPRAYLDAYQPLIRLNALFVGKAVPAIDYYTAKLRLLVALINENRGRPIDAYAPSSTAFVTFETIADARRAAKYMQVHPRNPLACIVVPAPDAADLDWVRIMKSSFAGEFLKDWVVELGVWIFTCLWIIPISLFVGLVSIQNISIFIPGLRRYLSKHPEKTEAISSLLPTIFVSILTILIPMLLLLIAKKVHTIITFSKLHDTIMIRYWKFLVCNLLIFFCVGVAALESFLESFRKNINNPLPLVASTFPTAGPFYVGWLILQTAIHGFLELGLFGLPLLVYPATRAAKTLRRRAAGIRPRTFNYYYWLPNHVLVTTITFCFALLNPLVIPFTFVYFSVESVIVKHQLIHVYAKIYDNNGKLILIRIVRYSLDGLILAQAIFFAFLVVLKVEVEASLAGLLLGLTVITKIVITRICRAKFFDGDQVEDEVYSGREEIVQEPSAALEDGEGGAFDSRMATLGSLMPRGGSSRFMTWRMPAGELFNYASVPARPPHNTRRGEIPFGPKRNYASLTHVASPEKFEASPTSASGGFSIGGADIRNVIEEHPRAPEYRGGGTSASLAQQNIVAQQGSLVTEHAKHERWDDSPRLNRPYQNPYYVQPIDNFLWLPRNPFGVLDLDDSVDLHHSLTSEAGGGELSQSIRETLEHELIAAASGPLVETPGSIPSANAPAQEGSLFLTKRKFSGNEEISMSSILSARVRRIEQEIEVDEASASRSPFVVDGRSISIGKRPGTMRRQSSTFSNISYPSVVSNGNSISASRERQRRRSTTMPTWQSSGAYDPVHEPDVQAEGMLLESTLNLPLASDPRPSRIIDRREPSREGAVSMREAVVEEIIAEAQVEAMDRLRKEEEEKEKLAREARKSSWWTLWMWNRSRQGDFIPPSHSDPHTAGD